MLHTVTTEHTVIRLKQFIHVQTLIVQRSILLHQARTRMYKLAGGSHDELFGFHSLPKRSHILIQSFTGFPRDINTEWKTKANSTATPVTHTLICFVTRTLDKKAAVLVIIRPDHPDALRWIKNHAEDGRFLWFIHPFWCDETVFFWQPFKDTLWMFEKKCTKASLVRPKVCPWALFCACLQTLQETDTSSEWLTKGAVNMSTLVTMTGD